jgi:hypothetical protein
VAAKYKTDTKQKYVHSLIKYAVGALLRVISREHQRTTLDSFDMRDGSVGVGRRKIRVHVNVRLHRQDQRNCKNGEKNVGSHSGYKVTPREMQLLKAGWGTKTEKRRKRVPTLVRKRVAWLYGVENE